MRYDEEAKIFADLLKDKNLLKSQIAGSTDIQQIGKRSINFFRTYQRLIKAKSCTIGHSFILGSSINGVLGTWTGTEDGQQLVLGEANKVCTWVVIHHGDNTFTEDFSTTDYQDTGNANWNTSSERLNMSTSTIRLPQLTYYNIGPFYLDPTINLTDVTITATEFRWNPGDHILYFISTNGTDWEEININTPTTLSQPGTNAYLKIIFVGIGGADTYVDDITIEYTTG